MLTFHYSVKRVDLKNMSVHDTLKVILLKLKLALRIYSCLLTKIMFILGIALFWWLPSPLLDGGFLIRLKNITYYSTIILESIFNKLQNLNINLHNVYELHKTEILEILKNTKKIVKHIFKLFLKRRGRLFSWFRKKY